MESNVTVCYAASKAYLPYLRASLESLPRRVPKLLIWYDPEHKSPGLEYENLRVINWETKLKNWQKGLNLAVRKVRTEWVLLADADYLFPDFIFQIIEDTLKGVSHRTVLHFFLARLNQQRTAEVLAAKKKWQDYYEKYEGAVEYVQPSLWSRALAKLCRVLTNSLYIEYGTRKIGYELIFGNINPCVFNKEFFLKLGGYDPKFVGWGGEDDDLEWRAQKEGAIDVRLPVVVAHLWHPRIMDFDNYLTGSTAYGKKKKG